MIRGLDVAFIAAVTVLGACSAPKEDGVTQGEAGNAIVSLSEGPCMGVCPVYDMTLHPDGDYKLNGVQNVKQTGLSEGNLGEDAFAQAEAALNEAGFWTMKRRQTAETLPNCHGDDAPTVKVTWRTDAGKQKTVTFYAGCEQDDTRGMIARLRIALHFDDLVWTNEKFEYHAPAPN